MITYTSKAANKIKSFVDLVAWQESHKLVLQIYKQSQLFPKYEQFGLTSQLRRAAVSITSNIAEGFARTSSKEKCQFYNIAMGSITEVWNQLMIARDVSYLKEEEFSELEKQVISASKLTKALLKRTQSWS